METPKESVEPFKFFELHIDPPELSPKNKGPKRFWGYQDPVEGWGDGDHYIGIINSYKINGNGTILVSFTQLWKIASDDGELKWHQAGEPPLEMVLSFVQLHMIFFFLFLQISSSLFIRKNYGTIPIK